MATALRLRTIELGYNRHQTKFGNDSWFAVVLRSSAHHMIEAGFLPGGTGNCGRSTLKALSQQRISGDDNARGSQ